MLQLLLQYCKEKFKQDLLIASIDFMSKTSDHLVL